MLTLMRRLPNALGKRVDPREQEVVIGDHQPIIVRLIRREGPQVILGIESPSGTSVRVPSQPKRSQRSHTRLSGGFRLSRTRIWSPKLSQGSPPRLKQPLQNPLRKRLQEANKSPSDQPRKTTDESHQPG